MIKKVWDFLDYNRFTVMVPILALLIWIFAVGCTPTVISPVDPAKVVTAEGLATEYAVWQKQIEAKQIEFDAAGQDIEKQKAQQAEFKSFLVSLASGSVADLPGLLQLLLSGGLIGTLSDNIRKNGVIAGLKKGKA